MLLQINQIQQALQYDKSIFLKKKKNFLKWHKRIHCFSTMNSSFENTPRRNWEIHMDWENND